MEDASLLPLAVVYLTAGVIAVPIARRLGLGSVLGYLIAGILIGPFTLQLVGNYSGVMHFAEFGVVIMLFLIGLEVRPSVLWAMRGVLFGLGGAQVVLTALVLAAAILALGLDWRAALALGFILSLSSTAVVLQTFAEKGLQHTSAGTATFGILLFQDISTIPMFAALPLLVLGAGQAAGPGDMLAQFPAWMHALAVMAAVALIIIAGRYLTRPIFRFIADTRSREIFTATALLLVIAVTLLMETVGLSAALGAFLAGVMLADSEYRRELESDIEPFRGLLLGLFFISVGAGINVGFIVQHLALVAALVIGLMAIKALVIFAIARVFRVDSRAASLTAVALAQGSEFAFVMLGIAQANGIIETRISVLATAAVAISMALTPLALMGYQRWCTRSLSSGPEPENDAFDDRPDVIVAGFGRFGQIAARRLIVNGFKTSTLDASAEQVELVRRFGRRVYYGDATRLDLLKASGAADAKLLIVAIDDRDQAETLVEIAARHFPNLKILARAYDRRHTYRLLEKGAHIVERETFEASLTLGAEALKFLGFKDFQAERAARLFRRHDENVFRALAPVWKDEERFIIASKETSDRMNDLLAADIQSMLQETEDESA
ncbi:monovalent cation:proton antiporter-2 (CPA2) family protein [Eoetvoesiella caeni]|uniref:Kef-type potassium/proton antiporter (CPA2 family) n=1 Tax=Eoetvoesiella caeni TaxID=645616 RepID=A0A366HK43_9BURK|nr:monovalent cation:proton antiporter-2 (CPA2) family protein [Eoetvoesiella caeni]MCI2807665.1 monovalent cation:proton antiporter-2 (CPA2) family protein [Eoetvoesiella caeni]NYT52940.1 cation:proton antiporter [Eoetvoesiella caeni]RBP42917.1 Kef-type potassium/proton antiporter (CPA2 family) [Eoetvoesiella caeni]